MSSRTPFLTLALAATAVAIHLLPPGVTAALQFDRAAVAAGEWWRLLTAHLTHFGANHLTWDVSVLLALGWACEGHARRPMGLALLVSALAISLAVWAWQPQFDTYRGLSGLACTLFALHATSLLRLGSRAPRVVGLLALLGLGAKCLFEMATATTLFASGTGYEPVPLAHLMGGLVGGVAGTGLPWLNASGQRRTKAARIRARIIANPPIF